MPNPMCIVPTSEERWLDSAALSRNCDSESNAATSSPAGIAGSPWNAVVALKTSIIRASPSATWATLSAKPALPPKYLASSTAPINDGQHEAGLKAGIR